VVYKAKKKIELRMIEMNDLEMMLASDERRRHDRHVDLVANCSFVALLHDYYYCHHHYHVLFLFQLFSVME
jgi:hypothetical protein